MTDTLQQIRSRGYADALAGKPRQLLGLTGEEIVWYLFGYASAKVGLSR
jgi:hypothetical protein